MNKYTDSLIARPEKSNELPRGVVTRELQLSRFSTQSCEFDSTELVDVGGQRGRRSRLHRMHIDEGRKAKGGRGPTQADSGHGSAK